MIRLDVHDYHRVHCGYHYVVLLFLIYVLNEVISLAVQIYVTAVYMHRLKELASEATSLLIIANCIVHAINSFLYHLLKNIMNRTNQMYWSTTNGNGLWRSDLNGYGAIAIFADNVQTVGESITNLKVICC